MSLLEEFLPDVIEKAYVIRPRALKVTEEHGLTICGSRQLASPGNTLYWNKSRSWLYEHSLLIFDELEAWTKLRELVQVKVNKTCKTLTAQESALAIARSKVSALTPRSNEWSYH